MSLFPKFLYPVYDPCKNVLDAAKDWGAGRLESTDDYDLVMRQPFRVAAVRVLFNEPTVYGYNPQVGNVDWSKFDLVLLSDQEYFTPGQVRSWATKNGIRKYLFAAGGTTAEDPLNPEFEIHRPHFVNVFLERNVYQDTAADFKPFMFDVMLGARRPHRDWVMLALTKSGLLDSTVTTYRSGFPGEVVNEQNQQFAQKFADTDLNWPYVSPNLDPTWEVPEVSNRISCITPNGIYKNTWYTITCETLSTGSTFYFSEKTVKAMFNKRIFVVFGPQYFLANLKKMGFETFGSYIDESYDQEPLDDVRYSKAMLQVMRLAWLEDPVQVHRSLKFAVDQNYQRLHSLQVQYQWDMREMVHAHIPAQHWLWN